MVTAEEGRDFLNIKGKGCVVKLKTELLNSPLRTLNTITAERHF